MKHLLLIAAVALTLPAGGCMAKPRFLIYPQGITFTGWHNPNFESCAWTRDPNNPRPCPIVIHLPTGDLGEKELSDAAALKRAGWAENGPTGLMLRGNPMVLCQYENGVLVNVTLSVLPGNGGGPGALSIDGKRVTLPATDEAITQVLGAPLRRE